MKSSPALFRFKDSIVTVTHPLENIGLQILQQLRLVGIVSSWVRYVFSYDPIECVSANPHSPDCSDVFETTLTFSFHDGRTVFLALTSESTPILDVSFINWILTTVTVCDPRARVFLRTWHPVNGRGTLWWERRNSQDRPNHS